MTTFTGPDAHPTKPAYACACGNFALAQDGTAELSALAQNDSIRVSKIAKGSKVFGVHYAIDAMGANTAFQFGYESEDGVEADADYFGSVADASAAGAGFLACMPFTAQRDTYVTAKQTGSGTATGTLALAAFSIFTNSVD